MKTRNAETPKPTPAKKTPVKRETNKTPSKPEADNNAAEATSKTVEVKTGSAGVKKQAASKAVSKAASTAEENLPSNAKAAPAAKPAEKKTVTKAKSPAAGKAAVSTIKTPEQAAAKAPDAEKPKISDASKKESPKPAVKVKDSDQSKNIEDGEEIAKNEGEEKVEDTIEEKQDVDAHPEDEDYIEEMVEYEEEEGFEEPGDEEYAEEEGSEQEEETGKMDEEQMEMSAIMKDRKVKKQHEIFVGGLDRDAVEEDVKKAFEMIGEVVEVRLHRNFETNKNKGFAFVKFATKEQATRALAELANPTIRGKRCGIAPSEDNDTLFLGNICNTWTKEAIKRKLKEYGVENVENINLVGDAQNEGLSRGFAFLEFPCHEDAMAAYKRLQKPDVIFGHPERTAKVAFSEPLREPDHGIMAQVKSVFVDGLPPYWDEDRVKEQFKSYGEIERVVLARNMSSAKRKDFGFINFTTHDGAMALIEGINNTELGDGKSKTKARARLANPLPKTQAVKGGMRGGFRIGRAGIGIYSRSVRGSGFGRHHLNRDGFQRGRGFYPRGRGRGGRFSFTDGDDAKIPYSNFRGRRPFVGQGGRKGSSRNAYEGFGEEFVSRGPTSSRSDVERPRRSSYDGRVKPFQSGRHPYSPQEDYGRSFSGRRFGDDNYPYSESGHGIKRPYSMVDHDSGYLESGSRLRARYDHSDSASRGTHYRDSLETGTGFYSRDYYGTDFDRSSYPSFYGGERTPRGGYYY